MGFIGRVKGFVRGTAENARAAAEYSGRPIFSVLCDMAGCFVFRGVWPDQYRHMGFAKLDAKQRSGHLTNRVERRIERKLCDHRRFGNVFKNKYRFYQTYSDFFGRECFRSETLTEEELEKLWNGGDRFIYKPAEGKGGGGVKVFKRNELPAAGVPFALDMLHGMPKGVVEQMIIQHPDLSALYPDAVNPVRVVTVYKDGVCHRVYGTLTLGRAKEFANASSDALFALIDVDTGRVTTNLVDYEHIKYEKHPTTGMPVKGFVIPMWDKVEELLDKAAAVLPQMGLVSWDIAVTPEGPVLIEGNNKGGYYGYQFYEFAEEGVDTETAKLFKPYLDK